MTAKTSQPLSERTPAAARSLVLSQISARLISRYALTSSIAIPAWPPRLKQARRAVASHPTSS